LHASHHTRSRPASSLRPSTCAVYERAPHTRHRGAAPCRPSAPSGAALSAGLRGSSTARAHPSSQGTSRR
jgi:hypothetical protein